MRIIRNSSLSSDFTVPTPFGTVNLPRVERPKMGFPQVDERRRKAVIHAFAADLSGVFSLIPYVGNLINEQLDDLHGAEIRRILTPEEYNRFERDDKKIPSNGLAMLYSFVR